jgi:SAM-dependent methyltransferase
MTRDQLLDELRSAEVRGACGLFPRGARLLELGGGNGFQARILADAGFQVSSIDIAGRPRGSLRFPVQDYDGKTIPFANGHFDGVFSSNVLEHIPHLPITFAELRRVLVPGGMAVHLLPTPAWRFWTSVVEYPATIQDLWRRRVRKANSAAARESALAVDLGTSSAAVAAPRMSTARALRGHLTRAFEPHGEYGSAFSELYYFSRSRWQRVFDSNGFELIEQHPTGIFYTGQLMCLEKRLADRERWARWLGSSCQVYVMRARQG